MKTIKTYKSATLTKVVIVKKHEELAKLNVNMYEIIEAIKLANNKPVQFVIDIISATDEDSAYEKYETQQNNKNKLAA